MPCSKRLPARSAFLLAALMFGTPIFAQDPAVGVEDPVVSWGLSSLTDYDTGQPFLDIARNMRPLFGFTQEEWEVMDHATLVAGGYLDSDGYPIRIPRGLRGVRTIWAWGETFGAEQRAGLYILTYQGRGSLNLGGSATVISSAPGRIIFENTTGTSFWLDITAIDSGNHVRDISILRADHVALAEAGAMFNPVFLDLIADARELRFMDWQNTNNSRLSHWEERPLPTEASWTDRGAPLEVMVRLANETGTDPWFNMPHAADDDYIRQFATYVRDNLDPRLKVHVEYSNEVWNSAFGQFHWLREQAIADWGADVSEDWETIFSYHTMRATQVAQIWEEVFGPDSSSRLINILGTQTSNTWFSELQLRAPGWRTHSPDTFVEPATVFEEMAGTSYFGGDLVSNADLRQELAARFKQSGDKTYSWIFEIMSQDNETAEAIPTSLRILAEHKAIAERNGMRFTLYEGGQHMHHSFAVDGLTEEEAEEVGRYLEGFVRSPEMGALYADLWEGWRAIGDGPFMQFGETSAPSRWGSWGLLAYPGDMNPRARFVIARQAEGGSWWGEGGGPQYLQGRTTIGSEGADEMTGTVEEDFFASLGGDDIFIASPGVDGFNGGEGTDTYVLSDGPEGYTIAPEGAGHRITGPQGSAYLAKVEAIRFGDGTSRALD